MSGLVRAAVFVAIVAVCIVCAVKNMLGRTDADGIYDLIHRYSFKSVLGALLVVAIVLGVLVALVN